MRSQWRLGLAVLFTLSSRAKGFYIPLEVEQMPTITAQTPSPITAFPFDDSFSMRCEAKGNPPPAYRWTKDGEDFDPQLNSLIKTEQNNGTFILHTKYLSKFRGKYRCYASNKMGTAITEEIVLIVPNVPKFPKEKIPPIVVEEGQPVVLSCNPPEGMPPRQIYWMSVGLQHIDQDERVSMGKDGNLYFSNALQKDNRKDYCCFAAFSAIRTIVQKTAIPVEVNNNSIVVPERQPSLLLPSGVQSEVILVKGQELELECIAQGFPTPVIEWIKMGEKLPQRTNIKNFGKLLTITNIEEVDAGKYLCKARNSAGDAVHYYDVIVEEPPKWLLEPPKSQLAVVGEDVHIKCSVTGMPQPDIVWRRNGKTLDDDLSSQRKVFDDTLILHNAKPEDSAVYQCEASNRHGTILANANIMITNMAPLMLTMDYQEYAVVQGGDIVMDCRVFSSPPPSISWNKGEDGAIIERERFSVLENGSLKAFKAKKEDSGEYICFASNAEGKSTITAVLNVKDPTRIVEPPQNLRILRGTTAQLNCLAEFDKSLSKDFVLQWTRDGEEISPNFTAHSRYVADKGTLQIINVTQSDQGVYTCIARTRLDQDAAVAVVTVLDVPDAPEDLELYDRKGRSVSLSWIPQSDHNNSVTEFLVEYKESQWDPENWHELQRVPGNKVTADLLLQGHLDYQFRVSAVNAIGRGPPSQPTERFQTNATVPDRNPDDIRIRGHLPHQMDISWEPLLPVEHNGPGLEYKLSYRRLGVEDVWKEHLVKRHSFVVKDTPTFVPYEIKVQSRNSHGWGPEPKTVTGYSGEDLPLAAPRDVGVEVINTTLLRVNWTMVPPSTVRGHLGGYNVHWLRTRSLLRTNQIPDERYSLAFPGNRTHVLVPDLKPFSEYRLTVNVYNKKGNGPSCDPVVFHTPEGVPEQVPILTASNAQEDSITLVWGPPFEANGILSGYLLQYQNVNSLDMNELIEVNISGADTTQWLLQGLEEGSLYRFQLSACTQVGCGLPRAQESSTLAQAVPSLLNISSYVSDTFAKISWTAREEQQDSQLYVAYMNNCEGNWRVSEAVKVSQRYHVIDGLEPGTMYTVRLMAKRLLDKASIFEDVIQTRVKGAAGLKENFSSQGWFIGIMCAVALLTLTVLIACFVRRKKGGKYAVKEKEELHPEVDSQGMNDDAFSEYRDEKLLQGSQCSLDRNFGGSNISQDSLVDYAEGGIQFNEDGSFIGEYSVH